MARHRCVKRGQAHNLEAVSDEEMSEEEFKTQRKKRKQDNEENGNLATLLGATKYHPFWIRSILRGQNVTVLMGSDATHNFIDEGLVTRMKLKTKDFEGFKVVMEDGFTTPCTQMIL